MALVLKKLYLGYNQIFIKNADPRTQDLWGIPSLPIMLGYIGFYLYFVKVLGPRLMKNRPPFDIKILLIVYNSLQIVFNVWIAYEYSYTYWRIHEGCIPIDYSTSALALHVMAGGRKYFWLKMFDCLDTIFFVLRKSHRQISFLHVYHHSAMVFGTWLGLMFYAGGNSVFLPAINVLVHAVMFSYYLLTCIDSSWKSSRIFKRTLTQMQMVQFIALVIIYGRALQADCTFPKFPSYAMTTQSSFMFIMFFDFYRKEYLSANKKEKKVEGNL
ncbi:hypothetical protein JTB14_016766 [Gonioctena quinquepunctata]|nr:hypothetical protein JTB14_016766 [Gonioctena quinquepunctata]